MDRPKTEDIDAEDEEPLELDGDAQPLDFHVNENHVELQPYEALERQLRPVLDAAEVEEKPEEVPWDDDLVNWSEDE